jgi:hypothetical protein
VYVSNILTGLQQATPAAWTAGMEWYRLAFVLARRLARELGVTTEQAAYAIAALSPRTSWPENVRAINAIADHLQAGGTLDNFQVTLRVTHTNRAKAWIILTTGNLDAIGQGQKTRAFADNICHPLTSREVTVDSWAYRIAAGIDRAFPMRCLCPSVEALRRGGCCCLHRGWPIDTGCCLLSFRRSLGDCPSPGG